MFDFKKKAFKLEKRIRLVISVLLMSFFLTFSTFFYFDKALIFIPILIVTSFILTYFSLLVGIKKAAWFGLFLMPVTLTAFFYLFYFLFPGRWLTRLPFIVFYAVSYYALLLSSNIFNVGVEKNLQLYRAAFSINFFYQAVVSFLIFSVLFSTKSIFLANAIIGGGIGFLLSLQLFWSIKLDKHLSHEIVNFSLFVGIVLTELAFLVSFIPLKTTISSLFLTGSLYAMEGMIYHFIDQKFFKETIREYVFVWVFVLIITLLSISW